MVRRQPDAAIEAGFGVGGSKGLRRWQRGVMKEGRKEEGGRRKTRDEVVVV